MSLEISLSERPDVIVFELGGSLDITTASALDQAFSEKMDQSKKFGFDLEKVEFIDSSGIGELVKIYSSGKRGQFEVYIFGATDAVESALKAGHVDRFLQIMSKREFNRKCPSANDMGDLIRRL